MIEPMMAPASGPGGVAVAKGDDAKAKATTRAKATATATPTRVENAISLRGTRAWRDWLRRFAAHCRADGATLIDQALARHARAEGFEAPPPRR
jgi:hypothetical protein